MCQATGSTRVCACPELYVLSAGSTGDDTACPPRSFSYTLTEALAALPIFLGSQRLAPGAGLTVSMPLPLGPDYTGVFQLILRSGAISGWAVTPIGDISLFAPSDVTSNVTGNATNCNAGAFKTKGLTELRCFEVSAPSLARPARARPT